MRIAVHPPLIRVLIGKEWAELYRNTMLLGSVIFLPLLFAAIPLLTLWSVGGMVGEGMGDGLEAMGHWQGLCDGLASGDCSLALFLAQFNLMFMFIPIILPSTILPYAIVGEKTQRSLEPLLATPISSLDLLLAKALSALIPATLATWLSFLVYAIGAWLLLPNRAVLAVIFQPHWIFVVVVLGPMLALFASDLALMISSRSTEPRVAQQVAGLVVLPLVLLLLAQMSGFLIITPALVWLMGLLLVVLDGIMTYLTVQIFDREAILTRWA